MMFRTIRTNECPCIQCEFKDSKVLFRRMIGPDFNLYYQKSIIDGVSFLGKDIRRAITLPADLIDIS